MHIISTSRVPAYARKPAAAEQKKIAEPDNREVDGTDTSSLITPSGDATAQQRKETGKYHSDYFEERIAKTSPIPEKGKLPEASRQQRKMAACIPEQATIPRRKTSSTTLTAG